MVGKKNFETSLEREERKYFHEFLPNLYKRH